MKTLIALAADALFSGFAGAAHAEEPITLGEPGYGGTGCPGGSVSATLSPDATSLSLLFDSYQVEAGGETGKKFDRKSCNIAIPVHVPHGISISILSIDYDARLQPNTHFGRDGWVIVRADGDEVRVDFHTRVMP